MRKLDLFAFIVGSLFILLNFFSEYNLGIAGFRSDFDSSYMQASNYFVFGNQSIKSTPVFSYGPLSFLMVSWQAIYNKAKIFCLLFDLLTIAGILMLVYKIQQYKYSVFSLLFVFILLQILPSTEYRIFLLGFLFLYYFYYSNNRIIYLLLCNFLLLALFIKSTYLLLYISLIPIFIEKLKTYKRKSYHIISYHIISLVLFTLLLYYFLNYTPVDIYLVFRGYLELSIGNSSSMSLLDQNVPWNNYFIYSTIVIILWFRGWKIPIFLSFILGNYIFLKYAMARSDFYHVHPLFYFSIIFFFLYILKLRSQMKDLVSLGIYVIALSSLFIFVNKANVDKKPIELNQVIQDRIINRFVNFINIKNTIDNYNSFKDLFKDQKFEYNAELLPKEFLEIIKDDTVDIYPNESGRVIGAGLNWHNRPVYQSYIASRKWLIEQNVKFFDSEEAPKYIIIHPTNTLSIDGRYLFNDELDTILTIRKRYHPIIITKEGFILLKKNDIYRKNQEHQLLQSNSNEISIWSPLRISLDYSSLNSARDVCIAKVHLDKSLLGTIKKMFYKEEPISILYRDKQNTRLFRLLPDISNLGILLYPFPTTDEELYNFFLGKEQDHVDEFIELQVVTHNNKLYKNKWNVQIECFRD